MEQDKALNLLQKQVERLVEIQSEILEEQAQLDRERATAQAQFDRKTQKARAKYDELVAQLEAFALDFRDEIFPKGKKSLQIGDVKLGFRFGQPVIEIGGKPADKDRLLDRLHDQISETSGAEKQLYQGCIEIKESVSLTKVKALPEAAFDRLKLRLVQQEKFFVDLPKPE